MASSMVAERLQTIRYPTMPQAARKPNLPYGLAAEDCTTCKLQKDNLFCRLPERATREWEQIKHVTSYPEGALLFVEGEAARECISCARGK